MHPIHVKTKLLLFLTILAATNIIADGEPSVSGEQPKVLGQGSQCIVCDHSPGMVQKFIKPQPSFNSGPVDPKVVAPLAEELTAIARKCGIEELVPVKAHCGTLLQEKMINLDIGNGFNNSLDKSMLIRNKVVNILGAPEINTGIPAPNGNVLVVCVDGNPNNVWLTTNGWKQIDQFYFKAVHPSDAAKLPSSTNADALDTFKKLAVSVSCNDCGPPQFGTPVLNAPKSLLQIKSASQTPAKTVTLPAKSVPPQFQGTPKMSTGFFSSAPGSSKQNLNTTRPKSLRPTSLKPNWFPRSR